MAECIRLLLSEQPGKPPQAVGFDLPHLEREELFINDYSLAPQEWDAGPMGCGELILELRLRMSQLQPGATFKLIANDPGVPEDLPAWCRMTGNRLLRAAPPEFLIERKTY